MDNTMKNHVERLITRSAEAEASHEALHLSQAALNAANALCSLKVIDAPRIQ